MTLKQLYAYAKDKNAIITYKDGEYCVKYQKNVYFTSDRQDAIDTLDHMVSKSKVPEIECSICGRIHRRDKCPLDY